MADVDHASASTSSRSHANHAGEEETMTPPTPDRRPSAGSSSASPKSSAKGKASADVEAQQSRDDDDEEEAERRQAGEKAGDKPEDKYKIVQWDEPDPSTLPPKEKRGLDEPDPITDPDNPQGWSKGKRVLILIITCLTSTCVTCASSIVAACYPNLMRDFGISETVAILGLTTFIGGLGSGPVFIAPLSEFYGRKPIYLWSFGAFVLLNLPVAFANNVAVFMIFRFWTGFAGSAFLSVAGGTVADLYRPHEFFIPMALYSASPMAGPELGPLFSGFINYYDNNWQWAFWSIIIWAAVMWLAIALFVPETFHPKILTLKARRLRKETGDESYRSKHEIDTAQKTIRQTLAVSMKRVPQLLALEPILFLLCLWSAILLGIIYMFFEAYPIVFEQQHGFTIWQTGLSFLGIFVGMIIALCTMPWFSAQYTKARHAHHGNAPPEARLPPAMAGSFLTVIGLFIFAFTSYSHVPWIAPVLGSIPFGTGVILNFIAIFTFTTDAYRPVAASAMACNSVFRSTFAAGFPLFTNPMYHALGTDGATALLAGINVLMIPVPFLLYRYGAAIRKRSRFTM